MSSKPKPKLTKPVIASFNPHTMALSLNLGDAKTHKILIKGPDGIAVVDNEEITVAPNNGKIWIDVIELNHAIPYSLPGKYYLAVKGVAAKNDVHANSEWTETQFELTAGEAALANTRLNHKQNAAITKAVGKVEAEVAGKWKPFPDIKPIIADLKQSVENGKVYTNELLKGFQKRISLALGKMSKLKGAPTASLRGLKAVLKMTPAANPPTPPTTPVAPAANATPAGFGASQGTLPATVLIIALFVLAAMAIAEYGPIAETHAVAPNGFVNPTVPAATPAAPPAKTVYKPVQDDNVNVPPLSLAIPEQPGPIFREIDLPFPALESQVTATNTIINPNEIVYFKKPSEDYTLLPYFNPCVMEGKKVPAPDAIKTGPDTYDKYIGIRMWLKPTYQEHSQPITIVVQ